LKTINAHIFLRALSMASLCALIFFTAACQGEAEVPRHAFIGGEIINPTSNSIVLHRNGKIIDTIYLDEKNRFSYRLENVEKGLYLIKHRPESQNLYLVPGDSLLIRVNTVAFDESLHFSGTGNARNNFLAEMFLVDEQNADLLLSFNETEPSDFARKADSIKQKRLQTLQETAKKNGFSKDFIDLSETIIEYESYDLKERYTYLIQKYYKEYYRNLPEDFHAYRANVNFNLETLQCSPTYKRFIDDFLVNYSLQWCADSARDENDCYDLTSTANVIARINKVSELVKLPSLRKYFLSKLGVLGIIMAKNDKNIDDVLDVLQENDYPEIDMEEMEQLAAIQSTYLPGSTVANIPLINTDGDEVLFDDVLKRPTVIFLWSIYNQTHPNYHMLLNELRLKYPEINFIGINLDIEEVSKWKKAVTKYGYNPDKEFQLRKTNVNKKLFQYYLNKTVFLDSSGKIIVGDAFITSRNLENQILEFLNQE